MRPLFSIDSFIQTMSTFSATAEGVTRFPLTYHAAEARTYLATVMKHLGLSVTIDCVGNVRGRYSGANSQAKAVLLGSHYDSVLQAGKFDGVAGIACSLAALHQVIQQGYRFDFPIEVVAFEAEEGCDFKSPLIGSKAVTGQLSADDLKSIVNTEQRDYFSMCVEQGWLPEQLPEQQFTPDNTAAFIELHIEQASTLDKKGIPLGVVTAISALRRVRFEFFGQSNHAGATPMDQRQDALVVATAFIQQIPQIILDYGSPAGSVTCGRILCYPNRANVIPGQVVLEIDMRDTSDEAITALLNGAIHTATAISAAQSVDFHYERMGFGDAVTMNDDLRQQLKASCERLSYAYTDIHSGAGHDAGIIGKSIPTAMLFVPSIGGFSHNPQENTPTEFLEQGARVLADFLVHFCSS